MDQAAFYGVVSAINFTLLGLWWVAVKDRISVGSTGAGFHRMAYFVSLQFVIPATVSLLAQVAPDRPEVWRSAFAIAGVAGAVGIGMLAREMTHHSASTYVPKAFGLLGVPLYVLVLVVALWPGVISDIGIDLAPIEVEGLLLSVLIFLGVQEAWFVSMTPPPAAQ
jgi:cytochrome bd-type quinol oxidase subunit 2